MHEVQKFVGISLHCNYSDVFVWFMWWLFCRKEVYMRVFSDTIQHGRSWGGLKLIVTCSHQVLMMTVQKLSPTIPLRAGFFLIHEFWTWGPFWVARKCLRLLIATWYPSTNSPANNQCNLKFKRARLRNSILLLKILRPFFFFFSEPMLFIKPTISS